MQWCTNAITALDQDEYAKNYESLTERYTALQKRYTTLTRQREDKQFKADELSGFLFELGELDILTEMIRQTVMQNASASVTEEEYRRRYNDLTDRFRTEEEKHKRLTAERKRMAAESVAISGMLSELTELEAPPIEFDEKLWHAVVDRVTVYNDDRLVYSLKDGNEITVML